MQLFECLQSISDLRKKRGIRHPFQSVLKLVLLGFTCRLVAIEHMVSFFEPIWDQIKGPLGFKRRKPPDPTTIRRMLNGLKPEQFQKAFEQWVGEMIEGKTFMVSVDGKALRSVRGENGLARMLVNVFAHDVKLALAEYPIEEKNGEATVLKEALAQLFDRYPGLKILTGDAAFAGRELNQAIISLGRDYIVQIKENQPKLKKLLEEEFQAIIPQKVPAAVEVKKKYGEERWELWVDSNVGAALIGNLTKFPGLKQIACIRKRVYQQEELIGEEVRYHITSASKRKLPPKQFLRGIRGHWQIENTLHHVKDRSWNEDKMYSKVPAQGWILGKLRNQALNIVRTLSQKLAWKKQSMPKWCAQLLSNPKQTLALMRNL